MHGFRITRSLRILATVTAVLMATACGGGDHNPTGPGGGFGGDHGGNGGGGNGGGGNGDGGNGGGGNDGGQTGFAGDYRLFSVGFIALPADLTFDQCNPTRVLGGALRMNDDGTWEFAVQMIQFGADDELDDEGTWQWDGTLLHFQSDAYGDSFTAKIDDGIRMDYDYCPDGQSDIQLVFGK